MISGIQLSNNEPGHGFNFDTRICLDVLRKMQSFNNLAKEYLEMTGNPNFTTDLTPCLQ